MRPSSLLRGLLALALGGTAALAVATAAPAAPAPSDAVVLAAPDISLANTRAHIQQFQNIATANGGNRRSNTAGYTASQNYVFNQLSAAGFSVVRQTCASGCIAGAGPNVIADWPGGNASNVYLFGAHLDGVAAGPGSNDNASGSATVLEIALTLARTNPTMLNHVRFAFWTDEEQGLNGSQFYANTLPTAERSRLRGYFNFDMVASTNGGYFINRITSSLGQTLRAYYDTNFPGLAPEENVEGAGRSDDASFNAIGIQTSGVAAGASANKTSAQVAKWGGTTGDYDPCYHQSCDRFPANISDTVLNRAGDAAAHALWTLAVGTGTPPTTVFSDTFETNTGWATNPNGTDNATTGTWERGDPEATTSSGAKQLGTTVSGVNDLVTGRKRCGELRHRRWYDEHPVTGDHPAGDGHPQPVAVLVSRPRLELLERRLLPRLYRPQWRHDGTVHPGGRGHQPQRCLGLRYVEHQRVRRAVGPRPHRGRRRRDRQPRGGRRRRRPDHQPVGPPPGGRPPGRVAGRSAPHGPRRTGRAARSAPRAPGALSGRYRPAFRRSPVR